MFTLCAKCVTIQQSPRRHSNEERALVDTRVTMESQKALEKGYKVLQIYEV